MSKNNTVPVRLEQLRLPPVGAQSKLFHESTFVQSRVSTIQTSNFFTQLDVYAAGGRTNAFDDDVAFFARNIGDFLREWIMFGSVLITAKGADRRSPEFVVRTARNVKYHIDPRSRHHVVTVKGRNVPITFTYQNKLPDEDGFIDSMAITAIPVLARMETLTNAQFNATVGSASTYVVADKNTGRKLEAPVPSVAAPAESDPSVFDPQRAVFDPEFLAPPRRSFFIKRSQDPRSERNPETGTFVDSIMPDDDNLRVVQFSRGAFDIQNFRDAMGRLGAQLDNYLSVPAMSTETAVSHGKSSSAALRMASFDMLEYRRMRKNYWRQVITDCIVKWIAFKYDAQVHVEFPRSASDVLDEMTLQEAGIDPSVE